MPRRGGGGGGGAGQGYRSHGSKDVSKGGDGARKEQGRGGSQDRETRISKLVSYVLRHGAKKEGLRIDESGFVNVGELVSLSFLIHFCFLIFLFFFTIAQE